MESGYENENFTAKRPSSIRKVSQSSSEFGSESESRLNTRYRSESTVLKRKKIAKNIPARSVAQVASKKHCLCSYQDDKIGSNAVGDTGKGRMFFSLKNP